MEDINKKEDINKLKTICVDCKYHKGPKTDSTWYRHRCLHPRIEIPKRQDPVSGIWGYGPCFEENSKEKNPYCKDINKYGDCSLYEKKPTYLEIFGDTLLGFAMVNNEFRK